MTTKFWRATLERAGKTFCQSLVVTVGAGWADVMSVGWKQALTVSAGAALLSLATSVGSAKVGDSDSPSLVDEKH
jgi:hypothetical protein